MGDATGSRAAGGGQPGDSTGTVRLLGLVARASLSAFEQLALASSQAEELGDSLLFARLAARQFDQMNQVESVLAGEGITPENAMRPFSSALNSFEQATTPTTWAERLLKVHLTRGLGSDFVDLVSPRLPGDLLGLISHGKASTLLEGQADERLRAVLAAAPDDRGRVSLFGRRVLGEALGQAQWVAAREVELSSLLTGASEDSSHDLERISEMMGEVTSRHNARMEALGLFT